MLKKLIFITASFFMLTNYSFAASADFNEKQKTEIGKIVHDYIVEHPEVITEAIQALQANEVKAWVEKAKQAALSNIDPIFNSTSPSRDVKDPKVTVVEFFDYNCPHCKVMTKTLSDVLAQNKDIRLVYKELPVLNEGSLFAAKVALAAREQNKYEEVHHKLMESQEILTQENSLAIAKELGLDMDKLQKDVASEKINEELLANRKIALAIGLRGTPAFIIGKSPASKDMVIELIPGEIKQEELLEKIKKVK